MCIFLFWSTIVIFSILTKNSRKKFKIRKKTKKFLFSICLSFVFGANFFHIFRTDSTLLDLPRYANFFPKLFVDLEIKFLKGKNETI